MGTGMEGRQRVGEILTAPPHPNSRTSSALSTAEKPPVPEGTGLLGLLLSDGRPHFS